MITEAGLETIAQHPTMDYAKDGIRVNAVAPCVVDTPTHRETPWPARSRRRPPDHFVVGLLDADQKAVWAAVRNQRRLLKNPPVTAIGMLETLRQMNTAGSTRK
jgi:NAD(P)-dependent dehydrogenase (short-subunit alcohol dehydrogenase family)